MSRRLSAAFLVLSVWGTACGLKLPDDEDIDGAIDDVATDLGLGGSGSLDVSAVLSALFPDLSADEIAELSASFSLEAALALEAELEAFREEAEEFSLDLFQTSAERVEERQMDLEPGDGFPETLTPLGQACFYDEAAGTATISLSGVFSGKTPIQLAAENVSVLVDGELQAGELSCLAQGESVDIVLLIDITGSMGNVIASVRDSVVAFTEAVSESGLTGTLSVVTFQDTVGVDVTFQEPAPARNYERTPFFEPVDMANSGEVDDLQAFVRRLEANAGADLPENLAAAVDFARNSVIGGSVVDGDSGPEGTRPFPALESDQQVFIALTDVTFHADGTRSTSLLPEFRPRAASVIARTLHQTGTVVHVVDPSWSDHGIDPESATTDEVDADYWALQTGGLGEDVVLGYSLLDLELVAVAEETGLLDVVLDAVLKTSCRFEFSAELTLESEVEVQLEVGEESYSELVPVTVF